MKSNKVTIYIIQSKFIIWIPCPHSTLLWTSIFWYEIDKICWEKAGQTPLNYLYVRIFKYVKSNLIKE